VRIAPLVISKDIARNGVDSSY